VEAGNAECAASVHRKRERELPCRTLSALPHAKAETQRKGLLARSCSPDFSDWLAELAWLALVSNDVDVRRATRGRGPRKIGEDALTVYRLKGYIYNLE